MAHITRQSWPDSGPGFQVEMVKPCYSVAFQAGDCASRQADSHHQTTLDAVFVYVVPWSEFLIALSQLVAAKAGDCASREAAGRSLGMVLL